MAANTHKRMGLKEMSFPYPLNSVISAVADEQKSSPSFNRLRLIFNNEKVGLLLRSLPLQFEYIWIKSYTILLNKSQLPRIFDWS